MTHNPIIGNCDTMLFLGGKEKNTLKDLAESLGKETIDMVSTSENRGNSPSYGRSFQKLGKQLMSIDELAVMDRSKCVLQLRGVRPFFSEKFNITKHKNYRYLSDYRKENTFDIKRYLNRKLKVKENDVYEFFEVGEIDVDAA